MFRLLYQGLKKIEEDIKEEKKESVSFLHAFVLFPVRLISIIHIEDTSNKEWQIFNINDWFIFFLSLFWFLDIIVIAVQVTFDFYVTQTYKQKSCAYFLQLYFGFTPSFATAFFKGVPGLKFIFFAPLLSTVILSSVVVVVFAARVDTFEDPTVNALVVDVDVKRRSTATISWRRVTVADDFVIDMIKLFWSLGGCWLIIVDLCPFVLMGIYSCV